MPLVSLFIDLQNKFLARGFNNPIQTSFPPCFQGDTLTLLLRFMNPTGNASVPYVDVDQSTATVQAAVGTIGGLPTGGTFTITDPDATQTTAAIAYNADAPSVQAAIRAGLTTNWSLATVSGSAGGPWTITNGANAARSALVFATGALTPTSQSTVLVQQAGSGSTPAIQYAKLQLSPIAYQNTWTPSPAPTITVANVQTGGVSGSNSIQSVTLNNQPYNGTFTLSFGGQTTAPISYNASPSAVQSAFQALSSVGSGNAAVGGAVGAYQITFIGTLGGLAQAAITASAAGLIGPLALIGSFSLATVGVEEAIGEIASITQTFEINVQPAGGSPQTVLQVPIQIFNDLIPNAPAIPTPTAVYLTEAQSDARYLQLANWLNGNPAALAVSAAGSSSVARSAPTTTQYIGAAAGSGAYTYALTLSTTSAQRGDIMRLNVSLPASTNPTINIVGATTESLVGTGAAFKSHLEWTYNGTAWDLNFRTA